MSLLHLRAACCSSKMPLYNTAGGIELRTMSPVGITRTELPFKDGDYAFERERAQTKLTPDGLKPVPHDECKAEHKLSKALFKKIASNVFSAKESSAISFPVAYSEPRSFLERGADLFSFLVTKYIDLAIAEKDDIRKRLAYIATGIMAGFHIDMNPKKVFNPYLGETYVGAWSNGTKFFGEQSSHHPPISDFQIFGPDNSWTCSAHADFDVESGMNQAEIKQNGTYKLELSDGTKYEWTFPSVYVTGFMKGDKTIKIKGELNVVDITNNLICSIKLHPQKNTKKNLNNPQASTIYGGIKVNDKKIKISISNDFDQEVTGDYCREIFYNGEKLFDIATDVSERPTTQLEEDLLLLSDSRFRLDRVLLIKGELEEADKAKIALEDIQRREEKQRGTIKKSQSSPSLFKQLKYGK